jgi:hypothetical protein
VSLQAGGGRALSKGREDGLHVVPFVVCPVQVNVEVAVDDDSGSVLRRLADLGKEYLQSLQGLLAV